METPSQVSTSFTQPSSATKSSNQLFPGNHQAQTVTGNYNQVNYSGNQISIVNNYVSPLTQALQGNIHWNLPLRNEKFIGREQLLEKIEDVLKISRSNNNSNNNVIQSNTVMISVIYGLGGIGKTQLVIEYLYRHLAEYTCILWIFADKSEQIEATYMQFAQTMKLPGSQPSEVLFQIHYWLQQQPSCLLIFDNASNYASVKNYLPKTGKHHILITSRDSNWVGSKIEIDVFTPDEAKAYLKKFVSLFEQAKAIEALAKTLGHLPLALAQAGAYIAKTNLSIDAYLKKYEEDKEAYLSDKTLPIGNEHVPVFLTWNITFQTIQTVCPLANHLMILSAYCQSQGIPYNLFYQATLIDFEKQSKKGLSKIAAALLNKLKSKVETVVVSPEKSWDDARALLQQYAIWRVEENSKTIAVHPLIQTVIRLQQNAKMTYRYLQQLIQITGKCYPHFKNTLEDYVVKRVWLPHLTMFLLHWDARLKQAPDNIQPSVAKEAVLTLLNYLWDGYFDLGDAKRQRECCERTLKIKEAHYPKDHREIAKTLTNLGNAYGALGDSAKSRELLERALNIKEVHYPKDHPEIAITLTNLSLAYGELGDSAKKRELLERALKIFEAHYLKDHLAIAITLGNLGIAYGELGDSQKMRELLERALKINEAHYPKDHPEIAKTLTNLGNAYGALGDSAKSRELLERALNIKEVHYPKDHPEIAITLTNLSLAYGELGDSAKKRELLERALKIFEAHYPKDHPQIAKILTNLGVTYGELGDSQKMRELLERALKMEEAHYPKDHPEIAKILTNLGDVYRALGDSAKSWKLLERALNIKEAHYPKDHPQIAITLTNLGVAYGDLGDSAKKRELLECALKIKEAFYGKDHPQAAFTRYILAGALWKLGEKSLAFAYTEQAYQVLSEYPDYGANHPWTKSAKKQFEEFATEMPQLAISNKSHPATFFKSSSTAVASDKSSVDVSATDFNADGKKVSSEKEELELNASFSIGKQS